MKNGNIKNIDDFKTRFKMLTEHKVNPVNEYRLIDKDPYDYSDVSNDDHLDEDDETPEKKISNKPQEENPTDEPKEEVPEQNKEIEKSDNNDIKQDELPQDSQDEPVEKQQPIEDEPEVEVNPEINVDFDKQIRKLDDVINNIGQLSLKLDQMNNQMNNISNEMESLVKDVEEVKEPSDIEKLEMRALDSFPYNTNINNYWNRKIDNETNSGYVTKNGVTKTDDGYELEYIPMNNNL